MRQRNTASVVRNYLGFTDAPSIQDIENLWTGLEPEEFTNHEQYYTIILDQYKIYVEMADRISARRGLANTFFLTLNTSIFAALSLFSEHHVTPGPGTVVFPLFGAIIECLAWYGLLRSYQQLNAGKYAIIGALEQQLPASPYWRGEWDALGRGTPHSRYQPMTHIEQIVPVLFAATYLGWFIAVLASWH